MNDTKIYFENGVEWNRVWTKAEASQNTTYDPFNKNDFINKTREKRGTLGEIMDLSKELSIKREEKAGIDIYKQKEIEKYSARRAGRKPPLGMF